MKDICKLDDAIIAEFDRLSACEKSCEILVKKIVHEYEEMILLRNVLWKVIADKYGKVLTVEERERLTIDHEKKLLQLNSKEDLLEQRLKQDRLKDYKKNILEILNRGE